MMFRLIPKYPGPVGCHQNSISPFSAPTSTVIQLRRPSPGPAVHCGGGCVQTPPGRRNHTYRFCCSDPLFVQINVPASVTVAASIGIPCFVMSIAFSWFAGNGIEPDAVCMYIVVGPYPCHDSPDRA